MDPNDEVGSKRNLDDTYGTSAKRVKVLQEGSVDDDLLGELGDFLKDSEEALRSLKPAVEQQNIPRRNFHQPYRSVPTPKFGVRGLNAKEINLEGRIVSDRPAENLDQDIVLTRGKHSESISYVLWLQIPYFTQS